MVGSTSDRRRFVVALGGIAVAGFAGCTGGSGGGATPTSTDTVEPADAEHEEELPPGVSMEEFVRGPVPEVYRTALSQADERRDPDDLRTKEAVRFAEAEDSEFAGPGQSCENCAEYIPDKNGDGFGACTKVEGYVGPEDWCTIWESIEEHEAGEEHEEDE